MQLMFPFLGRPLPWFLSIYYRFKPLIPLRFLLFLRRWRARRIRERTRDIWPIYTKSAQPPSNWKGWPDGKQFGFVLTHDVEGSRGMKRVRQVSELEERLGFRSSFNFVAQDYPVPESLRRNLRERGFEIGLHGLHHNNNLYKSEYVFKKTAKVINAHLAKHSCIGFRSPAMYHNLDWIHSLNIRYDSSTFDTDPYEPQPDGVGTIFPFWVPSTNGTGGYVELPYTLPQDFCLFILFQERSPAIWKNKLDWIAENGGMALVIVHPDYMRFASAKSKIDEYPAEYYTEFLQYVRGHYAGRYWHGLPREAADLCIPKGQA
jgi:peptidoglycan/xylan/chitin deacetylase (PgdA/CDA1 family)